MSPVNCSAAITFTLLLLYPTPSSRPQTRQATAPIVQGGDKLTTLSQMIQTESKRLGLVLDKRAVSNPNIRILTESILNDQIARFAEAKYPLHIRSVNTRIDRNTIFVSVYEGKQILRERSVQSEHRMQDQFDREQRFQIKKAFANKVKVEKIAFIAFIDFKHPPQIYCSGLTFEARQVGAKS